MKGGLLKKMHPVGREVREKGGGEGEGEGEEEEGEGVKIKRVVCIYMHIYTFPTHI